MPKQSSSQFDYRESQITIIACMKENSKRLIKSRLAPHFTTLNFATHKRYIFHEVQPTVGGDRVPTSFNLIE